MSESEFEKRKGVIIDKVNTLMIKATNEQQAELRKVLKALAV